MALATFFPTFAGGIAFWLTQRYRLWPDYAATLVLGGIVTAAISAWVGFSAFDATRPSVKNREPDDEPIADALEGSANPYRAQVRRMVLAVSPRISGKATALVVVLSLVAAAVLVPASVRLPRWIEAELVIGLWWLVMAVTLVVLLYRGFRLKDDLVYFMPWDRPASEKNEGPAPGPARKRSSGWSAGSGCDPGFDCSGADGEGVIGVVVVGLALVVAFGAAWLVVEIAMPLVFFLMYSLLMRAIRRAARDQRGCEGELSRSLGWGVIWATIYVVPIALLTWGAHIAER
jgi:lysylphosphatidylglycerol synthetase-like protein (DUF2156 family)